MNIKKFYIIFKKYAGLKWTITAPIIYLVCRLVGMTNFESAKSGIIVLVIVYMVQFFGILLGTSIIRRRYYKGNLYLCIYGDGKLSKNLGYFHLENDRTLTELSNNYGYGRKKIISEKIDPKSEYQVISEATEETIHILKIK